MSTRKLLTATIISGRPEDGGKRIKIWVEKADQGDGSHYRWMSEEGDAEVTGKSLTEAKAMARRAWAGSAWSLRASWL